MARRNTILVSRTLYQVGVITVIGSIMWTLIALMQAINKTPTKIEVDKKILEPITIGIDKETLEKITSRKRIELKFETVPTTSTITTNSEIASTSASINQGGQ